MACKHGTEVLCSISKYKKSVIYLKEKMDVIGKLH
jgi:hypothetical protein